MYIQKIIRYNLTEKNEEIIELDEDIVRKFIGGRGTGVYLYTKYTNWNLDAFDPDNALIWTIGPFIGTRLPTATRTSLVFKSPLTGTISTSNAGGRFAPVLRKAGISGLMITGKLDTLSYLIFDGKSFRVEDASELKGKRVKETEDFLKQKYKRSEILAIGPAGENLVEFASITHNKENDFARGGPGAVMGSKNLKAIVLHHNFREEYPIHDSDKLEQLVKKFNTSTKESDITEKYSCVGTNMFPEYYKDIDGLTVNNFTVNSSQDKNPQYDMLHGKNIGMYQVKSTACYGCIVKCRHHYEVEGDRILTPEFESIQLLGPHIGVFDPEVILPLSEHVTDLGMDTISAGHIISSLIDLFENGKVKREILKNKRQLIQLFDEIANRRNELAQDMGKGAVKFSRKYDTADNVAHVKGMGLSAYEPRAVIGQGIGYGVSSRGGDHLRGGVSIAPEAMKLIVPLKNYLYSGKGYLVDFGTRIVATIDSVGTCIHGFEPYIGVNPMIGLMPGVVVSYFAALLPSIGFKFVNLKPVRDSLNAVTGLGFTTKDINNVAQRIITLERIYNNAQGFSKKDDYLVEKFYNENKGNTDPINKKKYTRELNIFYRKMGWDKSGVPTQKTIDKLELQDFVR